MSFEDSDHYKAWLRFRDAQAAEKDWMHQRVTWLLTSQGILFAAYGALLKISSDPPSTPPASIQAIQALAEVKSVIAFIGTLAAGIAVIGTSAAARMHWLWTTNLNLIVEKSHSQGILSFGSRPQWPARTSSILPPFLSCVFLSGWLYIWPTFLSKLEWRLGVAADRKSVV